MNTKSDLTAWLETTLGGLLPDFLRGARWFAGKARVIQAVSLEDAVWLAEEPKPFVLTISRVQYADGARERYVLLLSFVDEPGGLPVVGPRAAGPSGRAVVEASADVRGGLSLLHGFASARDLASLRGGRLRYADAPEAVARAMASLPERGTVSPLGAEQSNTSLRVDRNLVFKVFRKLDDGENPELEVGRFLASRTRFRATPMLQGSLTYTSAAGASSTIGVLQAWVENHGDGWRYVVEQLRQAAAGTGGEPLLRDMRQLGTITADFHAALAGDAELPDFAPEPVTARDIETWRSAFLERASQAFGLVERSLDAWPDPARRLGRSLLGLGRDAAVVEIPDVAAPSAQFRKIRVHGDYHLGQTLKTADGFVLIDLEGEPGRPLAERRLKYCALKDVAGMIRSFDYAVETARLAAGDAAGRAPSAESLRKAFLDGYLAAAAEQEAAYIPGDPLVVDAWIDFFESEKALYELEYEINNRPAWVHIPLSGLLRILQGRG
jgi:maltokinase